MNYLSMENMITKKLKKIAKTSKFAITVSCSESQGFGIQEIMACKNIPLLVWDQTVNYFDNFKLSGTALLSGTSYVVKK